MVLPRLRQDEAWISPVSNIENSSSMNRVTARSSRPHIIVAPRQRSNAYDISSSPAVHSAVTPRRIAATYKGPRPITQADRQRLIDNENDPQRESNALDPYLGGKRDAPLDLFVRFRQIVPDHRSRNNNQQQNNSTTDSNIDEDVSYFVYASHSDRQAGASGIVRVVSLTLQAKREDKFALIDLERNQPISAYLDSKMNTPSLSEYIIFQNRPFLKDVNISLSTKIELRDWLASKSAEMLEPWTSSSSVECTGTSGSLRFTVQNKNLRDVLKWSDYDESRTEHEVVSLRIEVVTSISRTLLLRGRDICGPELLMFCDSPLSTVWIRELLRVPHGMNTIVNLLMVEADNTLLLCILQTLGSLLFRGDTVLINQFFIGIMDLERLSGDSSKYNIMELSKTLAKISSMRTTDSVRDVIAEGCRENKIMFEQSPQAVLSIALMVTNFGIMIPPSRSCDVVIAKTEECLYQIIIELKAALNTIHLVNDTERIRHAVYQLVLQECDRCTDGPSIVNEVERIVEALEANQIKKQMGVDLTGSKKHSDDTLAPPVQLAPCVIANFILHVYHHLCLHSGNSKDERWLNFVTRWTHRACVILRGRETTQHALVHNMFSDLEDVLKISTDDKTIKAVNALFEGQKSYGDDVPTDALPIPPGSEEH